MAVIAVVSLLAAVSVSSLSSYGRSGNVNTGVSRLANALMQARSEAIARNTGVQLRVIVDDAGDNSSAGRVYSLWMRNADGGPDFQQISPWERLPDTVSLLDGAAWFSPTSEQNGDNPMAPTASGNSYNGVAYRGREVDTMAIEFAPSGGVRLPKPAQAYSYLLLASTVPGPNGRALSDRAGEVKDAEKSNWRQIRISNLTGQMRVNAP